jgi:hypothetical protein
MNTITEYTTEKKYKILGFNDDQCSCDICGKEELKGTYAIECLSSGEIIRAGSICGAKMAGWTTKELVSKYKKAEKEIIEAAKNEFRNSIEYIYYWDALNFLNKEDDEIEIKLFNCPDENLRKEIYATKRTFQSRMKHLGTFSELMEIKRLEIIAKYGIKNKYSI